VFCYKCALASSGPGAHISLPRALRGFKYLPAPHFSLLAKQLRLARRMARSLQRASIHNCASLAFSASRENRICHQRLAQRGCFCG